MTEPSELRDKLRNILDECWSLDEFRYSVAIPKLLALIEPLQAENENLKSMVRQYELILEPADIYAAKEIDRLKREIQKITKP